MLPVGEGAKVCKSYGALARSIQAIVFVVGAVISSCAVSSADELKRYSIAFIAENLNLYVSNTIPLDSLFMHVSPHFRWKINQPNDCGDRPCSPVLKAYRRLMTTPRSIAGPTGDLFNLQFGVNTVNEAQCIVDIWVERDTKPQSWDGRLLENAVTGHSVVLDLRQLRSDYTKLDRADTGDGYFYRFLVGPGVDLTGESHRVGSKSHKLIVREIWTLASGEKTDQSPWTDEYMVGADGSKGAYPSPMVEIVLRHGIPLFVSGEKDRDLTVAWLKKFFENCNSASH